jgi:hypothetical protein
LTKLARFVFCLFFEAGKNIPKVKKKHCYNIIVLTLLVLSLFHIILHLTLLVQSW